MRKIIPILILTTGIVLGSSWLPFPMCAAENTRTNVLLITIDTLRADRLSCYGSREVKTPHMDAWADKGALFLHAFAHNPLTLPSHANIFLGTTPPFHGVHENSKAIVTEDLLTMAEFFKAKGFATGAFIGAFPLDSRFGLAQGFDVYNESYPSKPGGTFTLAERTAGQVVAAAMDWLGNQRTPWFAWIHIWDPHAPYLPPEDFLKSYPTDPYAGEVAYVDSELGKLRDFLEVNRMADNTIMVLTGDHGEAFGEHGEERHGYFAYNTTLWIPLVITGPGVKASRIDEYVCHIDIFPTLCAMLEASPPDNLQGISLLPLMQGRKIKLRPVPIYFESLDAFYNNGWAPLRGFIEDRKKFIDSPLPELYSLDDDFKEERNLIKTPEAEIYRERLGKIMAGLAASQERQRRVLDKTARERLRSLGYITITASPAEKQYGPEDDLKTMLPFFQKMTESINLFSAGNLTGSKRLLTSVISEKPDLAFAYIHLAAIHDAQGNLQAALDVLADGYKHNPEHYDVVLQYGIRLVKLGHPDKGITILQQARDMLDFDPDVWLNLGIAYGNKGDISRALEAFKQALALDTSNAIIFNNLGVLYFSIFQKSGQKNDYVQASEYLKQAIALDPDMASAYNALGNLYQVSGNQEGAISLWEKAVELAPDFAFPVYNLGVAYLQKGNKSQALQYFTRYLKMSGKTLTPEDRQRVEAYIKQCQQR